MGARAQWFTRPVVVDERDPFAVEGPAPTRVALTRDQTASLDRRLAELIAQEAALFEEGVTCEVKDRSDTCCHACPLQQPAPGGFGRLCRVGLEQEKVMTLMAARGK